MSFITKTGWVLNSIDPSSVGVPIFFFLDKLILFSLHEILPASDFPFVLNWSLVGLFNMSPYGNVHFTRDSSIVKTTIQGSPHLYIYIYIYNCLNIKEL